VKVFDIPSGITAIQRLGEQLLLVTGEGMYSLNAKGEISFLAPDVDEAGNYTLHWD